MPSHTRSQPYGVDDVFPRSVTRDCFDTLGVSNSTVTNPGIAATWLECCGFLDDDVRGFHPLTWG